ncbi:uncharacterized protein [Epargyreus clarus]|uniref:uncharacterized protein n=1 Tax=Epargyreus clarus TaxID=520877 RepID=UPI003C2C76F6
MSATSQVSKTSAEAAPHLSAPVAKPTTSSSRPVLKTQRSLREKVLARTKTTTARSSVSEESVERCLPRDKPLTPTDSVLQKIETWELAEIPPRPIESDEEFSDASVLSDQGRPSIIRTSHRRSGVQMDMATKLANEQLQRAKEALEAAGNMKRECKTTTLECLQTLYETVLALSDSRSRHKYNLEKERSRHAQELVRIERAHNKHMADTIKSLTEDLRNTKKQIDANLEETRAVRSWLGYETQEPHKQIKGLVKSVGVVEQTMKDVLSKSAEKGKGEGSKHLEPLIKDHAKLITGVNSISAQMDRLRKDVERVRVCSDDIAITNNKILETQATNPTKDLAPTEIASISKKLDDLTETLQKTYTPHSPRTQPQDIQEHLQPITERLEAVSSELRTMRELKEKTPPPAISIGTEMALQELAKANTVKPTYAQAVSKPAPPKPSPNHTLIVSSTDPQKTGENVIETIRVALDLKRTGAKVDRVRKAKNQKVILSCRTKEDMSLIQSRVAADKQLKVEVARTNNPLAKIKDVLSYHTDAEIVEHILAQNKHLLSDVGEKDKAIRVRYRKKARNPHECHPILELSPVLHKKLTEAGTIYIGLQRRPIVDQSPLVQCTKCLGYGHTKAVCKEKDQACSYCGETHTWEKCPSRLKQKPPACVNCRRATGKSNETHQAFSDECPERRKWDAIARSRISYC